MKKIINSILGLIDLKLIKKNSFNNNFLNYISARDTVIGARRAGLSVCDYVEKEWDQIGETKKVIDRMEKLGVFKKSNPTVCEIGAGTGRYMEKVIDKCAPERYESYETAQDWADWLQNKYPIITQQSDGHSLKYTGDDSIDIVHSHGVFVYLPFFDSLRYFSEIERITKAGSYVVFDCITEECLDNELLGKWLNSENNFPRILPEKYIFDFFPSSKFNLVGNFFTAYGKGKSKYFVFKNTNIE